MNALETFQSHRRLLFSIAYRMLGSAAEAEDVLQDAYLRFSSAAESEIRTPKAFLTTIVTRLCLDRLKSARARREIYPGAWLPEPVLASPPSADPQTAAEQHESITLAFLVLLETLTPQERAVFLLREVFEYEYGEVAATLSLSEANCRQLFHRARQRVLGHRPRFQASPEQQQELVGRFLAAAQRGELDRLTSLLSQEVVFTADGGGKAVAARHPVYGTQAVARLIAGILSVAERQLSQSGEEYLADFAWINGEPGVLIWVRPRPTPPIPSPDAPAVSASAPSHPYPLSPSPSAAARLETAFIFTLSGDHITRIWAIRNPDKLAYLARQARPESAG